MKRSLVRRIRPLLVDKWAWKDFVRTADGSWFLDRMRDRFGIYHRIVALLEKSKWPKSANRRDELIDEAKALADSLFAETETFLENSSQEGETAEKGGDAC